MHWLCFHTVEVNEYKKCEVLKTFVYVNASFVIVIKHSFIDKANIYILKT